MTTGFVAYSEGSNDDVNKVLWSAWGWEPGQSANHILEEYGRSFLGPDAARGIARGVQRLEQNWRGPIIDNASIPATLTTLEAVAQAPGVDAASNWRLQQLLYRANYDAYLQERVRRDRRQTEQALAAPDQLGKSDAREALRQAAAAVTAPVACADSSLCRRAGELAGDLFRTIRMQLSVGRYHALAVGRGANLDTIDARLDDEPWLRERLRDADTAADDAGRRKAIDAILVVLRAEPGVMRDDLGIPGRHPRLLSGSTFAEDPSGLSGVYDAADYNQTGAAKPLAQRTYAGTLYDRPLWMRYTGLKPHTAYYLHAYFAGNGTAFRLRVNGQEVELNCRAYINCGEAEGDVPAQSNPCGTLVLEWSSPKGRGGNGRRLKIRTVELRSARR